MQRAPKRDCDHFGACHNQSVILLKQIILTTSLMMLSGSLLVGCTKHPATQGNPNNANMTAPGSTQQLSEAVKTFAEDQGSPGQEALHKLQNYPKPELVRRLVELNASLSPKDKLRPQIAFVLCWMGQDYASNVKVIQSALSKTSKYEGFNADDAYSMLDRLIQQGHKDLRTSLFEIAPSADGALSEGLSETFSRELKQNPEEFLTQLSPRSAKEREQVYKLIYASDAFSQSDLDGIRKRLATFPRTSAAFAPAQELLRYLAAKASG